MKKPIFKALAGFIIILCGLSCNADQSVLSKKNSAKLFISNPAQDDLLIVYDYEHKGAGLVQKPVSTKKLKGTFKAQIVKAFLGNCQFITQKKQVSLKRIEETQDETIFYLSTIPDLAKQTNLDLFKEALSLTISRHLKTNNFNIIYNETTAQL